MSVIEDRMKALDEGLDALERGDLEAFMSMLEENSHPDCEFHSALGSKLSGSPFRGIEEIRGWFSDLLASADALRWRDRRYEVLGDDAFLLLTTAELTGVTSRVPVGSEHAILYEVEDGLFKRGWSFTSHAEARAAAEALHA